MWEDEKPLVRTYIVGVVITLISTNCKYPTYIRDIHLPMAAVSIPAIPPLTPVFQTKCNVPFRKENFY